MGVALDWEEGKKDYQIYQFGRGFRKPIWYWLEGLTYYFLPIGKVWIPGNFL